MDPTDISHPPSQQINRKWVLCGLVGGMAVAAIVGSLPPPFGPFFVWISGGSLAGFVAIPLHLLIPDTLETTRVFWRLCATSSVIGGVLGAVLADQGCPLSEEVWIASITAGSMCGFAAVELLIRGLECRRADA